jgi:tRNA pseudouridine55 synthase
VTAGEYTIEEAVPLAELMETTEPEKYLGPVETMFRNYPQVKLTPKQEQRCRNGNSFTLNIADGTYRVYGENGEFLALSQVNDGVMSTIKSFFEV